MTTRIDFGSTEDRDRLAAEARRGHTSSGDEPLKPGPNSGSGETTLDHAEWHGMFASPDRVRELLDLPTYQLEEKLEELSKTDPEFAATVFAMFLREQGFSTGFRSLMLRFSQEEIGPEWDSFMHKMQRIDENDR